jgi:hypothetical protein
VRSVQNGPAVAARFNSSICPRRLDDPLRDELRGSEPFLVDVHQRDRHAVRQLRVAEQVADQRFREDG